MSSHWHSLSGKWDYYASYSLLPVNNEQPGSLTGWKSTTSFSNSLTAPIIGEQNGYICQVCQKGYIFLFSTDLWSNGLESDVCILSQLPVFKISNQYKSSQYKNCSINKTNEKIYFFG